MIDRPPRAPLRRLLLGPAIGLAAAAGLSCTLLVERELDQHAGPSDGGDGGCQEVTLDDGATDGGITFHGGVASPAFAGPAAPRPAFDSETFPSVLHFVAGGSLWLVMAAADPAVQPVVREVDQTGGVPSPGPGHVGPGPNRSSCDQLLAGVYEALPDVTRWRLISASCTPDGDAEADAGSTPGRPEAAGAAIGFAGGADGGHQVAIALGSLGAACDEAAPFDCLPPSASVPPSTALPAGSRRWLAGLQPDGAPPTWAISLQPATGDGSVRFFTADLSHQLSGGSLQLGGPLVPLAADYAAVVQLSGGALKVQVAGANGQPRAAATTLALGDSGARALEAARFAGSEIRLAWLGGDGLARSAPLDASDPAAPKLGAVTTVCGSAGASFAAPLSPSLVAVVSGGSLALRKVP